MRLGQPEPARPERAAHDRALAAEVAQRAQIVERGDPARGQHRQSGREHSPSSGRSGPGERAVAAGARHEQSRDAGRRRSAARARRVTSVSVHPAVGDDAAVPGIDRDHEPLAEPLGAAPRGRRRAPPCRPSTRVAPAASAACDRFRHRAGRRRPAPGRRAAATRSTRPGVGRPENAPSRSTTWSHGAPSATNRAAAAAGSPPSIVTARAGPRERRTQRPSRTSIAGMTANASMSLY